MKSIFSLMIFQVFTFCLINGQNSTWDKISFDEDGLLNRVEILSSDDYDGRGTGEKGNSLAQDFIIVKFKKWNVVPLYDCYRQDFQFKYRKDTLVGSNIVAKINGTEFPNKFIVISAHFDHLGNHNGKIYNGADDNASGTSALFSFAEYLSKNPPNHSVIIVAFDAEEKGLRGAKHFVNEFDEKSILANINLDMISRSPKNELYVVGSRHHESLQNIIESFENPTNTELLVGHDGSDDKDDWTNSSDHAPFHKKNIPFLYFGNEDHDGYHKPTDDYEFITPEFYKNSVKIILSLFETIDETGL